MAREDKPKKLSARVQDDGFDSSFDDEADAAKGNLFVWTIVILLLVGVALTCWIGSFYIFGHPEKAFSYSLLSKLKKLDTPKRFELTDAPRGEFLNAQQLLDRYGKLTPRELDRANETLLRNYIRNFKLTQDLVIYVSGTFNILDSYELSDKTFFTEGVVALAQSKDNPQMLLEHVFTADKKVIPSLQRTLLTGLDIGLVKTQDLSALIHVQKLPDGRMIFTVVPILYGNYASSQGPGSFSLEPPLLLNVEAGLPVLDIETMTQAEEKHASHRRKAGLGPAATAPRQQLVRVEKPMAPVEDRPVKKAEPVKAVAVTAPGIPVLPPDAPTMRAEPVNPLPIAAASPTPTDVTLQPFADPQASPTPSTISTTATGNWPTYSPGQMPRGRLVNVSDAGEIAGNAAADRMYLQGNFVVTASGPGGAVLRSQGALTESLGIGGRNGDTRIIVRFPAGIRPPSEGSTFSRDLRRPFLIDKVERTAEGKVNVYVREVTRP